jgi:hypothetical protein
VINEASIDSYSSQAARLALSVVRLVGSPPDHTVLSLPDPVSTAAKAAWEEVGHAYLRVSGQSWDGPKFLKREPSRHSSAPPRSQSGGAALQRQPPVPPPVVPVVNPDFKRWLQEEGKRAFSKAADALHALLEALFLRQVEFSGNALDCPVSRYLPAPFACSSDLHNDPPLPQDDSNSLI